MPVWAAVVIGLGSGLLGTVLSTVLRIRHERQGEIRLRALSAADDFAVATTRALTSVREAIDKRDQVAGDDDESVEAALKAVGELEEGAMRLVLLLGPSSRATRLATGAVSSLTAAIGSVEEWPPEPDDATATSEVEGVAEMESLWEDEIAEARMWHGIALERFHGYVEAASAQLWDRWPGLSRMRQRQGAQPR